MQTVSSQVVKDLIESDAKRINEVLAKVGQDDCNSHLMWPVLFYTAEELDDAFRSIQWELGDHCLLGRYLDQPREYDAWLIPLSTDMKAMAKEIVTTVHDPPLWNIFSLENTPLICELVKLGWHLEAGELNIYLNNNLLSSFEHRTFKRKRSGVRRYNRQLAAGAIELVSSNRFDPKLYTALIDRWYQRQVAACQGNLKDPIIEYCQDAKEEALRFLQPVYLEAFSRVAKQAEIEIVPMIVHHKESNQYIAAGFGLQVGHEVWTMPLRVVDTDFQYLSDWLWKTMAARFSAMRFCADGHDSSHLGDRGLAKFKEKYLKGCDGYMMQAFAAFPPDTKDKV